MVIGPDLPARVSLIDKITALHFPAYATAGAFLNILLRINSYRLAMH